MNTKLKKALYESIMQNVSKTIKHSINESIALEHDSEYNTMLMNLDDVRKSIPKNAPKEVYSKFYEFFDYIKTLADNNINDSYSFDDFKRDYRKIVHNIDLLFTTGMYKDIIYDIEANRSAPIEFISGNTRKYIQDFKLFDSDGDFSLLTNKDLKQIYDYFKGRKIYINFTSNFIMVNKQYTYMFPHSEQYIIELGEDYVNYEKIAYEDLLNLSIK